MPRSGRVAAVAAPLVVATLAAAGAAVAAVTAAAAGAAGDDRSPATVRDRAREVLGRDEFKDQTTLPQRVIEWIGDHFPTTSASSQGRGGSGLVGDVVLLVAAGGLVYLLVKVVRSIRRHPPRARPDSAVIDVQERRTAAAWRKQAEALEAEGRWRDAMLARYRELVTGLVDQGVLADVPGRTSGEYRVELAELRPGLGAAFTEATDLFERAWYGGEATGAAENQRFRALAAEVSQGASVRVSA
ncbi:MAG: hypothetical protein QOJ67_289 [Acidimicrobiaceae bacterium]